MDIVKIHDKEFVPYMKNDEIQELIKALALKVHEDYKDENSFISTLTFEKAQELIVHGSIDGGMIPKVKACITALSGGAKKTHIIDGRQEHSILEEIFSDKGVGTEVVKE